MDHRLMALYFCLVLYALCYQMQSPVLPYLIRSLSEAGEDGDGDVAVTFGKMKTLFSTMQLIGGLLSGPLIDRFGCKCVLILSFASSMLCYGKVDSGLVYWWKFHFVTPTSLGLVGIADTISLIYLSQIPTLLQHAVLGSRVYITLRTSAVDRAALMGYIGLAYGVGFAVGPAVGGIVAAYDLKLGAFIGAGGSLLGLLLIVLILDDPSDGADAEKKSDDAAPAGVSSGEGRGGLLQLLAVLRYPKIVSLLSSKALCGLAAALFYSNFSLLTSSHFNLDPDATGYFLSYVGFLLMLVQAFVIGELTRRFSERTIILGCLTGLAVGTFGIAMANTLGRLAVVLIPVVVAGTVFGNINTVQLTHMVPKSESGCIVALDMAVGTGVRMLSPLLGAYILSNFGYAYIGLSGSLLATLVLLSNLLLGG